MGDILPFSIGEPSEPSSGGVGLPLSLDGNQTPQRFSYDVHSLDCDDVIDGIADRRTEDPKYNKYIETMLDDLLQKANNGDKQAEQKYDDLIAALNKEDFQSIREVACETQKRPDLPVPESDVESDFGAESLEGGNEPIDKAVNQIYWEDLRNRRKRLFQGIPY